MLSERPYHPPRTLDQVIGYVREQSGKHFDPQVVEAFLKVLASP